MIGLILGGLVAVALVVYSLRVPAILYETVYLPPVGPSFKAHSLNGRGQVVLSSSAGLHIWDPNTGMRHVATTLVLQEQALKVNNAGQICGTLRDPNGCVRAFFWDPNTGIQRLGTFGKPDSCSMDINNKGQVLVRAGVTALYPKVFLWSRDAPPASADMRSAGFGSPRPDCMNDQAQVAGWAFDTHQPEFFAFRWDRTNIISTHPIGWQMTGTVHIDGNGSAMWIHPKRDVDPPQVVVWGEDDSERRIQFPGNAVYIIAVNEPGQMLVRVSRFRSRIARYFPLVEVHEDWLWDPQRGKMPVRMHGWRIRDFDPVDMNNEGWILGRDWDRRGTCRWLILKPIHWELR